jgi:outer membrane usher protein FimD/PapC
MAYTYSKASDDSSDRMFSFGFSVPLSKWLPRAWSSYSLSNSKKGYTRQNLGVSGTLLDDERLSYSLQQSHANHDAGIAVASTAVIVRSMPTSMRGITTPRITANSSVTVPAEQSWPIQMESRLLSH